MCPNAFNKVRCPSAVYRIALKSYRAPKDQQRDQPYIQHESIKAVKYHNELLAFVPYSANNCRVCATECFLSIRALS